MTQGDVGRIEKYAMPPTVDASAKTWDGRKEDAMSSNKTDGKKVRTEVMIMMTLRECKLWGWILP